LEIQFYGLKGISLGGGVQKKTEKEEERMVKVHNIWERGFCKGGEERSLRFTR